jgi:hypothetical protein
MKINDVPSPKAARWAKPLPSGSGAGGKRPGCPLTGLALLAAVLAALRTVLPPGRARSAAARLPARSARPGAVSGLSPRPDNGCGRVTT